ncbi:MAG: helix-turn-helix domain-containing protein [Terracidiphilus sp.]
MRRRLQTINTGQLSLPFLGEAEAAASSCSSGRTECLPTVPASRDRHRSRKATQPRNSNTQEIRELKTKHGTGKRKPVAKEKIPPHAKLQVSRDEAAELLSISVRGVDYLIATKQLSTRRIGTRVLIPIEDVLKFARSDHPQRLAG